MSTGLGSGNIGNTGNNVKQSGKSGGDARGIATGGAAGAGSGAAGVGVADDDGLGKGLARAGAGAGGGRIGGGNVSDNSYIGSINIKT